ncbi:uncharacterized protein METZ01_LOCUS253804, partial [marine metagenome]
MVTGKMVQRLFLFLLLIFVGPGVVLPAHADNTRLLDGLNAKSFKAKITAVEKLAASGDSRVVAPLRA